MPEPASPVMAAETVSTGVPSLLVVVADGMGGHVGGQLASRLVCESFVAVVASGRGDIGPRLAAALEAGNARLASEIVENPSLKGMGSTLVAGYLDCEGLRWVSVGDSKLLLFRQGRLARLNADHSHGALLDKQAAEGTISMEAARNDSRRSALHSALTGFPIPFQDLELSPVPLQDGDCLVFASDGLITLTGNEIAEVVSRMMPWSAERTADELLRAVEARQTPAQDNTTVVVVKVSLERSGSGMGSHSASEDTTTDVTTAISPPLRRG